MAAAANTWNEGGKEAHDQGLQLAQQAATGLVAGRLGYSRRASRTRRARWACLASQCLPHRRCGRHCCTLLLIAGGRRCRCLASTLAALLLLLLLLLALALALALLLCRAARLRRPRGRRRLHARQAVEEAADRLGGGQVQQQAHAQQREEAARRAVLVHHHHEHQQLQQRAHIEPHNDARERPRCLRLRLRRGGADAVGPELCAGGGGGRGGSVVSTQQLDQLSRQLSTLLLLTKHFGKRPWQLACSQGGR